MQKSAFFLGASLLVGVLASGCAGPEKKFGRGVSNLFEIVRMGEVRRSVEQTALFESPDIAYTTGFFRGLNRSLARTGVGVFQVVTFPIPPYDPIWTSYLTPNPVYPDSYKPRLIEDSTFSTDTAIGFSGGDIAPFVPGSRFSIFPH
jgi:putative exosortase-associated protein (TIGR04073 family)